MYQQNDFYALLLLVSVLISAVTLTFIWQRRSVPGAVPLMLLMTAMMGWTLTYTAHWLVSDPQVKLFWLDVTYFGVVIVPAGFFAFVLTYTERGYWLSWRTVALLAIEPIITLILLWTDRYHGLFFAGNRVEGVTAYLHGGPWFWVNVIYSYTLILISLLMLIDMFFRTRKVYRRQVGLLLLGALLPWVSSIISISNLNPMAGLDLPGIAFTMTGVIFTVGLLNARLLDLVPVARSVLIENMNDGVLVLDIQGRIVDINPAAQRLLHPLPDNLIGQPVEAVFRQWNAAIEQFRDTLEVHTEFSLEGTPSRYFDVQIIPLYSRSKRLSGRLITWHDISDRKNTEMEREKLIADLDAYAHTVAHDLKNPVTVLMGYSEVMLNKDYPLSHEESQTYLSHIHRSSHKLTTIIDELLLLSSIRKKNNVETDVIDMSGVVSEAISRLTNLIEQSHAEIMQPDVWLPALGYAPWIEEVWVNYISNAIKYGSTPPRIQLGANPTANGRIRFWVRDNGQGLSAEQQSRLFQQFERLEPSRVEGHGLGLSIVQRIVEKLNGEVGVESEPGQGSTFYFTLPTPS